MSEEMGPVQDGRDVVLRPVRAPEATKDAGVAPRARRTGTTVVHPTALVDGAAVLAAGVEVGPGAFVGPNIRLGPRVAVGVRAVLLEHLAIGEDVRIWPLAVLGGEPQDRAFRGDPSSTRIGARTQIREHVTVHRGTFADSVTVVGEDVLLMASSHVAHNCVVGDGVTICNGVLLAGHVEVAPRAIISGNVVVHQFVRIGASAMIGGGLRVARDVPPFALVEADSTVVGLNLTGLRRSGVDREVMAELKAIYALLATEEFDRVEAVARVSDMAQSDQGRAIANFLAGKSRRGMCAFRTGRR